MNFLAHLYLAKHDDELMLGNFIADSVKGSDLGMYDPGVAAGIRMHRMIDDFTDRHPVFRSSIELLRPTMGKFAGVVADIWYDHFLARDFDAWSDESLPEFTGRVHQLLVSRESIMPVRSRYFLQYMLVKKIPLPYASIEGLRMVLTGMSRRARFENRMHEGADLSAEQIRELQGHFEHFFPEIREKIHSVQDRFREA